MTHGYNQVRAVGFFRTLRNTDARLESLRSVGTCCDQGASCYEHPRAWNNALVDRLLEADIGIACAFCAKVPDRREAGHQCCLRGDGGSRSSQGERLVKHLVIPGCFVVGVEEQVGMALDEAGH